MKTLLVSLIPAGWVKATERTSVGSRLGLESSNQNRPSEEFNSSRKILTSSVSITQAGRSFTAELISMQSTLMDTLSKPEIMEGTRQVCFDN